MEKSTKISISEADALSQALSESDRAIETALGKKSAAQPRKVSKAAKAENDPMQAGARACGAKTRSGRPCRASAVSGRARCRMHGGTNPGAPEGNTLAVKHGIYSRALSDDDRALYERIELGSIDDEIKIARIRLRRALVEQMKIESGEEGLSKFQLAEVAISTVGQQAHAEVRRVRKDYRREINSLLRMISDLELKRMALKALGAGEGTPDEIAQRIKAALGEMDTVNGLTAPLTAPANRT